MSAGTAAVISIVLESASSSVGCRASSKSTPGAVMPSTLRWSDPTPSSMPAQRGELIDARDIAVLWFVSPSYPSPFIHFPSCLPATDTTDWQPSVILKGERHCENHGFCPIERSRINGRSEKPKIVNRSDMLC
jgi:hypothetical protein